MSAALVFFAVFWLYFDAWLERKKLKDIIQWLGFLLLSVSFMLAAIHIESSILPVSVLGAGTDVFLLGITRIMGYLLLIVDLAINPLIPKPNERAKSKNMKILIPMATFPAISMNFLFPVLAVMVGFLYLRRATIGLEDHLKPVALVFFILSIAEVLSLGFLLQNTENVALYNLVAPFGWLWLLVHVIILVAVLILAKWVFGYLLKRFASQLFIIFTSSILFIFLITTVSFTGLLVKQLQDDAITHLNSDVKVLGYAIESKRGEAVSDAQVLAQNTQVAQYVVDKSLKPLFDLSESFLLAKKESFLTIVDENSLVLARGDDRERIKDSLSDDTLVKKGIAGQSVSSIISKDGVLAPEVSIRGVSPIKTDDKIIGAVITGTSVDNAFVDGIKRATGLEASIYGDDKISATTLLAPDNKTRLIGIAEGDNNVKSRVLGKGEAYSGSVTLLNIPYFGAYLPLKDVDNNPVGMLYVGRRQIGVLQTAAQSIELTFIVAVILLAFSIFPAYFISKFLSDQIK